MKNTTIHEELSCFDTSAFHRPDRLWALRGFQGKKQLSPVTSCSLAGFRPNFSFSTCRAGQSLMRMSISRTIMIMNHCLKNSLISSWLWILIILDLDKMFRNIWRFASNKPDMDSTMSRSNANPLFCLGVCRWGVRVHIDRETQFVGQFLASFP